MKYAIEVISDIEDVVISDLSEHLFNIVKFKEIFPNFGNVNITGVHPFAYLIDQEINKKPVPKGIFPSVTIVDDTDQKDTDDTSPAIRKDIKITSAEVNDMIANRKNYVISDEAVMALKELTENDGEVWSEGHVRRRTHNMVGEIWSFNKKVKDKLYELIINYLCGVGRFSLHDNYDIVIHERTVNGQKSGSYNYDFGRIAYIGIIRFNAVTVNAEYIIDTEIKTLSGIKHSETEVKHSG